MYKIEKINVVKKSNLYKVDGYYDKFFSCYQDAWDFWEEELERKIKERKDLKLIRIGEDGEAAETVAALWVDLVMIASKEALDLFNDSCDLYCLPRVKEIGWYKWNDGEENWEVFD